MTRRSLIFLAAAAVLTLLVNLWFSNRATRILADSAGSVEEAYVALGYLDQFHSGLAEAEACARGFVITGSPVFKEDFVHAMHMVQRNLANIRRVTADNERQAEAIASITPAVNERLVLLASLIDLRERNAAQPNVQVAVLNGALLTRSIDATLNEMRTEELRLLRERQDGVVQARQWALWGPYIRVFVILVILFAMLTQVWLTLRSEAAARRELEQAAADEKMARKRAEEADRLKDEFLATLSHELRTPLTSMVGWSSLLEDPAHAPELMHQGIRSISEAARVQARLIDDLLDVSRIVSGKLKIVFGPVDLPGVIREAIASVSPSAQAKGITIRTELDETLDALVGDPARLQQVVWNLLANAVKFTHKGGQINVSLRRSDSNVEISVVDDGDGIDPEFLPHVFDRFRQFDSTATRRAGGLGLGLSIVKSLVEAHGGSVRVASPGLGSGSAFFVELPIVGGGNGTPPTPINASSSAEAGRGTPPRGAQPLLLAGRTVLVVDDDWRTLNIVTAMLSQSGARVVTADNTADGLKILETDNPDILISDVGMPTEDGLTFMRRLRTLPAAWAGVPAIALTAFARAEDRVAALGAGFNAYLAKPVTRETLVVECASLLRLVHDRNGKPAAVAARPAQF